MVKTYWAAEKDPKILGKALLEKIEAFERYVRESGLYSLWAAMHRQYHGLDDDGFTSHKIENKGESGELAVFNQNHLRELITHYRTLAQGQRASLEPMATDEDYESELQKIRAKGVLDHADRECELEDLRNDAIEFAAVYGVGWFRQCWYASGGNMVLPPNPELLINDGPEGISGSDRLPEEGSDTGLSEDATSLGMAPHPHDETLESAIGAVTDPAPDAGAAAGSSSSGGSADEGELVDDQGVRGGELRADVFLPTDVVLDLSKRNSKHDWWLLRTRVSRWTLAVEFPAARAKILAQTDPEPLRSQSIDLRMETFNAGVQAMRSKGTEDQIEVWEFWHRKTRAVPQGRLAYMLSDGTVLEAKDLGYKKVPIRWVAPGKIIGTPFFYTPAFDLLSPQEALNMLQSIALTNERAHGVGIILMPQGSNLVAEEISTGLAICEYIGGLGEPKAMNFSSTPQEVFANQDRIQNSMQKNIGVNGTIRGDPEANLKSGSALVFVQSQAVQFTSSFQNSIVRLYELSATDTIWIHQEYMDEEQAFEILGEQDAIDTQTFTKHDIKRIVRVKVEVVNPMMNTLAGRQQLVEGAVKMFGPEVIPPANYFRMLLTGRWEPVMRDQEKKLANAKKMAQLLSKGHGLVPRKPQVGPDGQPLLDEMGKPVMAPVGEAGLEYVRPLATDDHRYMVKHALTVLDSPAARSNEAVVKAVMEVVNAHKQLLATMTLQDPGMLEITGQMPLQSAMLMAGGGVGPHPGGPTDSPGAGPSPGGPGGGPPPPGGLPPPSPALKPGIDNAPPGPGHQPNMPQMPRSPTDGKPAGAPNLIGQRM